MDSSAKKYTTEYLKLAHKRCIFNKNEILESNECGCFYCLNVFLPIEIEEWTDENNAKGETAICPKCGIDSVIGSKSGFPVTDEFFLKEMKGYYF